MTYKSSTLLFALLLAFTLVPTRSTNADQQWVVYEGKEGPGYGKHIVFLTGDDEYRSEEAMPQMAKILATRHGFKCTVLFAIDPKDGTIKPDYQTNIPGTEALNDADLMVMFLRFRNLPDEQMKPIVDFANSGKPMIALRTSTHPFNIKTPDATYAKYDWQSKDPAGGFGQLVFGDTWVSHHGHHGKESTRAIINDQHADHPIVQSCEDIWGPTDVYGIVHLKPDDKILLWGQVLEGMSPSDKPIEGEKNNPMMPLAWTRTYTGETGNTSRVFCTTMGAATDLVSEGMRRLIANACYWGLEMEVPAKADVELVGEYNPTQFGFNKFVEGVKPEDHRL
ncbi:MAG: ThuA domain-containing protein [Planctomycetaceae bacterium]|nr:ThuA domain-containing protein [Planctomycetales bacterium]MCB9875255.1 ThuA domain-containing protein [Planctomycetaceae bacterium]MCB9937922.1 ThuA domain-containing protein [Planctomycetaceae bacterium]HRX82006.1 ThuA domain-containing protein [Pirellulaceae bacterium]